MSFAPAKSPLRQVSVQVKVIEASSRDLLLGRKASLPFRCCRQVAEYPDLIAVYRQCKFRAYFFRGLSENRKGVALKVTRFVNCAKLQDVTL